MKIKKNKHTLEINLNTFITDGGKVFKIDIDTIFQRIQEDVKEREIVFKEKCKNLDKEHYFYQFKIDNSKMSLYDELNKETYEHFVYHFLKEYYCDMNGCSPSQNGGNVFYSPYRPSTNLHIEMMDIKKKNTVKEFIFKHLVSGGYRRMYGHPAWRKTVNIKNGELIKFIDWIFESKMFDPYELTSTYVNNKIVKNDDFLGRCTKNHKTISELIILKCFRDDDLEALKHFITKYKIDFVKLDKLNKGHKDTMFLKLIMMGDRVSWNFRDYYKTYEQFLSYLLDTFPKVNKIIDLDDETFDGNNPNEIKELLLSINNNIFSRNEPLGQKEYSKMLDRIFKDKTTNK